MFVILSLPVNSSVLRPALCTPRLVLRMAMPEAPWHLASGWVGQCKAPAESCMRQESQGTASPLALLWPWPWPYDHCSLGLPRGLRAGLYGWADLLGLSGPWNPPGGGQGPDINRHPFGKGKRKMAASTSATTVPVPPCLSLRSPCTCNPARRP